MGSVSTMSTPLRLLPQIHWASDSRSWDYPAKVLIENEVL